jgi:hypothetical protein
MRQCAWSILLALALLLVGCHARDDNSSPQEVGADILLNPGDLAQSYLGLGAQIWTGDTAWIEPLEALNARWVRVSMSPSFDQTPEQAPCAASQDEMDAFVARNYSAVFGTQLAHAIRTRPPSRRKRSTDSRSGMPALPPGLVALSAAAADATSIARSTLSPNETMAAYAP